MNLKKEDGSIPKNIPSLPNDNNLYGKRKKLPDQVVIGYADNFDEREKILEATENGVNVIVWAFFNYDEKTGKIHQPKASLAVSLIEEDIPKNVIHLTSFGGWNGPHMPNSFSADELYNAWVEFNHLHGDVFDGFDWDLEGNDNPQSKTSDLTIDCLRKMIQMSRLAKRDNYIVGMAPPQSYLDVQSDSSIQSPHFEKKTHPDNKMNKDVGPFSQSLKLPPSLISPTWHPDFYYTSHNSYAYLLALHSDCFDFVSVQFYETWSRANYEVYHQKMDPSEYLVRYVKDLLFRQEGFHVSFQREFLPAKEDDGYNHNQLQENPTETKSQGETLFVNLPLNKLVFGFPNAWALDRKDGGALFFHPSDVQKAFHILRHDSEMQKENDYSLPRGCMFWCIHNEGDHGIYLAKGLSEIWKDKKEQVTNTHSSHALDTNIKTELFKRMTSSF